MNFEDKLKELHSPKNSNQKEIISIIKQMEKKYGRKDIIKALEQYIAAHRYIFGNYFYD